MDTCDKEGMLPLHLAAACSGNLNAVRSLCSNNRAHLQHPDYQGRTPLHIAASEPSKLNSLKNRKLDIARQLIREKKTLLAYLISLSSFLACSIP